MKILVVGASGFVGSHLASRFSAKFETVYKGVRRGSGKRAVRMDLSRPGEVRKALRKVKPELVVNAAAYGVSHRETDIGRAVDVNVRAVSMLIAECRAARVKRFVQIGTALEYGLTGGRVNESSPVRPSSVYAVTKAAATALALAEAEKPGLEILVLRPFWMWGEGEDDTKVVPQVIKACLLNRPIRLTDCRQVRDYLHVADAAAIMAELCLLKKLPKERIVNVASGRKIVLKTFLGGIAQVFDKEKLLRFGALMRRTNEAADLTADTSRLAKYASLRLPGQTLFRRRVLEAAIAMRKGGR